MIDEARRQPSSGRAVVAGVGAGLIGISCCAGPAAAALLGLTSAAVALDVAANLYEDWGWAFKLAAVSFAILVIVFGRRRSRRCSTKPNVARFTLILLTVGIGTYALVYAGTSSLGRAAEPSPAPKVVIPRGDPEEGILAAVRQVRRQYPGVLIEAEAASPPSVRFRVTFEVPEVDPLSAEYNEEITRRVGDSREATLLLMRAVAAQIPSVQRFSAYEDGMLVPTWSRNQVLATDEPEAYRGFDEYTRFVRGAQELGGYSQLQPNR